MGNYLSVVSASVDTSPSNWRAEWESFYRQVFAYKEDFSQLNFVDFDTGGFGWVMFVAKDLTLNQVWDRCKTSFPSSSVYKDLSDEVPNNERIAYSAYAVRMRNRVEADQELARHSAKMIAVQGDKTNTLLERLLLELWYHWRTGGGHLDLLNWTLCAGSRDLGGHVPTVYWYGGCLRVEGDPPDDYSEHMRARLVMSASLSVRSCQRLLWQKQSA